MTPLQQLDLSGLHVLDGGMATDGAQRFRPLRTALVCARARKLTRGHCRCASGLYSRPAPIASTASYQVSAEGFQKIVCDAPNAADAAANALRASVVLAEKVSEYQASSPRRIWIAASLGPYGAMLHNGAEYHGNYACGFDELVAFHSRRIAVLAQTNADFLAFESVPSLEEARAFLAALHPYPDVAALYQLHLPG